MGRLMENYKQATSESAAKERPLKSKSPPNTGVLKVEVLTTVSHLMEWKLEIIITGVGQYIARRNEYKKGNCAALNFPFYTHSAGRYTDRRL